MIRRWRWGTIAASSTLGIMIPPSILLVFLCEMLQISYGYLFAAAIYPGLCLAGLYILYIATHAFLRPGSAPKLSPAAISGCAATRASGY